MKPAQHRVGIDTSQLSYRIPAMLDHLVGRKRELRALESMVIRDGVRLISLVGPPGVGKTRLAIEAMARIAPQIKVSAQMVDLSPIANPALALPAVARALGQDDERTTLAEWIKRNLHDKPLFVILDNVEQLLPEFSLELAHLLAGCPVLTVIVTSREELHIRGEQIFRVLPLALPDGNGPKENAAVRRSPAVTLFVKRAREVVPNFTLTESNTHAVVEICTRLDGLPLAIELAAARISLFPPETLLIHLDQPLELLSDGARDLPARHRTLRKAIGWSYDLLDPAEQTLLRQIAVFSGGCTIEAIVAVCEAGEHVVDTLTSLARKNLLTVDRTSGIHQNTDRDPPPRLYLLDTIREYALEKLLSRPVEYAEIQERHATYYLHIAEQVAADIMNPERPADFDLLQQELDNFRAALQWTVSDAPDAELAVRLSAALSWFWYSRGYLNEGANWLERAQERESELRQAAPKAMLHVCLAGIALRKGDFSRALNSVIQGVALLRQIDAPAALAHALGLAGQAALGLGHLDEAEQFISEGLTIAQALDHPWHIGGTLWELSMVALRRGNFAKANDLALESYNLWSKIGDKQGVVLTMDVLSAAARGTNDLDRSRQIDEESLIIRRELGDNPGIGVSLRGLAEVARLRHQDSRARSLYAESIEIAVDVGDLPGTAACLEGLAAIAVHNDRMERAATLLGAADQARSQDGVSRPPAAPGVADSIAMVRENLPADVFARAWDVGYSQPLAKTVTSAKTYLVPQASTSRSSRHSEIFRPAPLSRRERHVTALVAQGYDNSQIAAELVLSKRTIETHVSNILRKLNLDSRVQIVLWATDQGLTADGTA